MTDTENLEFSWMNSERDNRFQNSNRRSGRIPPRHLESDCIVLQVFHLGEKLDISVGQAHESRKYSQAISRHRQHICDPGKLYCAGRK